MSSSHHTPVPFGSSANSSVINSPLGQLDQAIADTLAGTLRLRSLRIDDPTILTISSGVVTRTRSFHQIETEGAGGSDDLDTINGGSKGQLLFVVAANTAHTVVLRHSTGNIRTMSGADISLDSTEIMAALFYDGTNWLVLAEPVPVIDASTISYTPDDVNDYGGSDPGGVQEALDYLAAQAAGRTYFAVLRHVTASTVAAGGFTSGAWRTRPLTEISEQLGSFVSLASDRFTISVDGVYRIRASAPAYRVTLHQIRLYDVTHSAEVVVGTSEDSNNTNAITTRSCLDRIITVSGSTEFELQHYCSVTQATNGMGFPVTWGENVYAEVVLERLSD